MNRTIINAIEGRLLLTFKYKGTTRVAEPHTYGVQHNGIESLSAWQLSGGSGQDFRLYILHEMTMIEPQNQTFDDERPSYQKGDRRYANIFAEL